MMESLSSEGKRKKEPIDYAVAPQIADLVPIEFGKTYEVTKDGVRDALAKIVLSNGAELILKNGRFTKGDRVRIVRL